MQSWKLVARRGLLLCIAGVSLVSAGSGIGGYQTLNENARTYTFVAWPVGKSEPIRFKSSLYQKGSASYVRIDEGELFPEKDETPVRRTGDFDSLKVIDLSVAHQVSTPQGPAYVRDTLWYPAHVVGRQWVFLKVTGPVTLYTLKPGRGAYRGMDTGAGLEPYGEDAVRSKIMTNPQAARLLHQERAGHSVALGMGLAGLGLVATGTVTNLVADKAPGNPLVIVGLGLAAFSWIPHLMVADRLDAAIKAYNEGAVGSGSQGL